MTDLRPSGRQGKSVTSSALITDGAPDRIGFDWDSGNRILHVDDFQVGSDYQASGAVSTSRAYSGLGCSLAPGTFWSGVIDEVRIDNRVVKP